MKRFLAFASLLSSVSFAAAPINSISCHKPTGDSSITIEGPVAIVHINLLGAIAWQPKTLLDAEGQLVLDGKNELLAIDFALPADSCDDNLFGFTHIACRDEQPSTVKITVIDDLGQKSVKEVVSNGIGLMWLDNDPRVTLRGSDNQGTLITLQSCGT